MQACHPEQGWGGRIGQCKTWRGLQSPSAHRYTNTLMLGLAALRSAAWVSSSSSSLMGGATHSCLALLEFNDRGAGRVSQVLPTSQTSTHKQQQQLQQRPPLCVPPVQVNNAELGEELGLQEATVVAGHHNSAGLLRGVSEKWDDAVE